MASKILAGQTPKKATPPAENQEQTETGTMGLPPEILLKIFGAMKGSDAAKVSGVCRLWHGLLNEEPLWKHFLARDFHRVETERPKEHYRESFLFNRNLTHGIYATRVIEITEDLPTFMDDGHVCVNGSKLISGTLNDGIKIWDLASGECEKELMDHGWNVHSLVLTNEGELITTNIVGVIRIFDLKKAHCTHLFLGSGITVESNVIIYERNLIAGYADGSIKIWNMESGSHHTLSSHTSKVKSLILDKGKLISGALDGQIRIWNLENSVCETILEEDHNGVCSLLLSKEGKLISSHQGGAIKFWDLNRRVCERTIQAHIMTATIRFTKEGKLFSYGRVGAIKFWNLDNGALEMTLDDDEKFRYTSLCLTREKKLIAGDWPGKLKIWNLDSGQREMTIKTGRASQFLALTDDGKVITGDCTNEFTILDFNASNSKVFEELANLFELSARDPKVDRTMAMERFDRMPKRERELIYVELDQILTSENDNFSGCAASAFASSTPLQKAMAIRAYLIQKSIHQPNPAAKQE